MIDFKKLLKDQREVKLTMTKRTRKSAPPVLPRAPLGPPPASVKLTGDQDKALVAIDAWRREKRTDDNWMFSLSGFAGTGKTTLLQHLIEGLPIRPLCAAPTGKAASVLRSKLRGVIVKTVHQLIYQPQGDSVRKLEELEAKLAAAVADDKPIAGLMVDIKEEKQRLATLRPKFTIRPDNEAMRGKLLIVDEASMVDEMMMADLKKAEAKVLFVGDSGQLPPVRGESWFIKREHNATLTQIVRQAMDSPIIRLSMQIRELDVKISEWQDAKGAAAILNKGAIDPAVWMEADQVLTGQNYSRRKLNRFFRQKRGWAKTPLPRAGDKMICLKNDHQTLPAWINGVQFVATADVENLGGIENSLNCDYEGCDLTLDWYNYHALRTYSEDVQEEPREMRNGLFEADYAYAITVHKSQGSEWPFVLFADDEFNKGQVEFRARFLYTAVTRAKQRFLMAIN